MEIKDKINIFVGEKIVGINDSRLLNNSYFSFNTEILPSENFIGMTGLTLGWLLKETRLAIETNKKNRMTYLYGSEYIISLNISDVKNIEVTIGNGKNRSIIKSNEKIETFLETVINASKKISEISAGNSFGNTDVEIMLPDIIKSAEKTLKRIKNHG